MTGGEFSGVDIDLLADYVGGALDGTPDETVVAALVADDPAWRDAYDQLTVGVAAVGSELRLLGSVAEPMPAELSARLTDAFAALPPLTGQAAGPATGPVTDDSAQSGADGGRRQLHAVRPAEGAAPPRSARPAARRRLRRWAAPIAVAAGVVAFAGIGLGNLLTGGRTAQDEAASVAAGEYRAPTPGASVTALLDAAAGAERVIASGTDYRREMLNSSAVLSGPDEHTSLSQQRKSPERSGGLQAGIDAPPGLTRLNATDALLACLDAIATEHRSGPVDAKSVDYSSFEGSPAIVVRFTAKDGRWAWVSGPDCGTPGAGADTRYQVRVG